MMDLSRRVRFIDLRNLVEDVEEVHIGCYVYKFKKQGFFLKVDIYLKLKDESLFKFKTIGYTFDECFYAIPLPKGEINFIDKKELDLFFPEL